MSTLTFISLLLNEALSAGVGWMVNGVLVGVMLGCADRRARRCRAAVATFLLVWFTWMTLNVAANRTFHLWRAYKCSSALCYPLVTGGN
jgi:hypothetical protein